MPQRRQCTTHGGSSFVGVIVAPVIEGEGLSGVVDKEREGTRTEGAEEAVRISVRDVGEAGGFPASEWSPSSCTFSAMGESETASVSSGTTLAGVP